MRRNASGCCKSASSPDQESPMKPEEDRQVDCCLVQGKTVGAFE